jgi:WD40 repeat protein
MRILKFCLLFILISIALPRTHAQEGTHLEPITAQNAHRLTTQAILGDGSVSVMAWASDGSMLAVATPFELRIYHAGQATPTIYPQDIIITQLIWNVDNTLLASLDKKSNLQIWEPKSKEFILSWQSPSTTDYIYDLFFLPNDQIAMYILEGGQDFFGRLWLLDWHTQEVQQKEVTSGYVYLSAVLLRNEILVLAENGSQNGSGLNIASIVFYNVATNEMTGSLANLTPPIQQMLWQSSTSDILITLDNAGVVRFWSTAETYQELFALTLVENITTYMAVSPDGTQLLTTGEDFKVRVWDTSNGALLAVYPNQPNTPRELKVMPNGDIFAFGDENYPHMWNVATLEDKVNYKLESITAPLVKVGFNQETVIGLGTNGSIYEWNIESKQVQETKTGIPFTEKNSVISDDGQTIAVFNSVDKALYIWYQDKLEKFTPPQLERFEGLKIKGDLIFLALCETPENGIVHDECSLKYLDWTIYLMRFDGNLHTIVREDYFFNRRYADIDIPITNPIFKINTHSIIAKDSQGNLLTTLTGHQALIYDVRLNPSQTLLASASQDGTIILWGVNSH